MNTRGMNRREKLQYEAKQRRLHGSSKLDISMNAVSMVEENKMIDKALFGMAEINDDNIEAQGMAAYSPEFMYATETENKADMATTSGLNFNNPDW